MKFVAIFLITLLSVASPCLAEEYHFESLPVQENGRIKPLITVAQESLQLIHGKSKYSGRPALHIFTTWMLTPETWMTKEFIKIDHHGLKKALSFPKEKKFFSPKQISEHPRLNVLFSDLQVRTQRREKLNAYYQSIQRLEGQLLTFYGIAQGAVKLYPPIDDSESWRTLMQVPEKESEAFFKVLTSYSKTFVGGDQKAADQELRQNLDAFVQMANAQGQYPEPSAMKTEVHYQKLKPFFWTWILYFLTALLLALSFLVFAKVLRSVAWVTLLSAFALHTYGFILRCIITGRPPVSNMYETVIWVGWGVVLFAGLFAVLQKKPWIALVGAVVATLCMLVADFAPVILDGTLQPLEPVLRSNLWLTIHVMTITLSYAALFLAFGVGDYGIFLYLKDRQAHKKQIRELAQVTYRLIQVGVVLLTAGTILGGVWADYSWGRFWGWDPKETWAFIALMGYLAILHARLVGWVKDFGMLAGSVASFSLVIMAWYGVNFVLGAGLHSYGFGAGGIEYVSGFVGLHFVYLGYAWFVQRSTLLASS